MAVGGAGWLRGCLVSCTLPRHAAARRPQTCVAWEPPRVCSTLIECLQITSDPGIKGLSCLADTRVRACLSDGDEKGPRAPFLELSLVWSHLIPSGKTADLNFKGMGQVYW